MRRKAERAQSESDVLLRGLSAVLRPGTPAQIFAAMIDCLQEVIPFEDAVMLAPVPLAPDHLRCTAATWSAIEGRRVEVGKLLGRVRAKGGTAVARAARVPELSAHADVLGDRAGSLLAVPFEDDDGCGVLIVLHSRPAALSRDHLKLLTRFSVLAAQAQAHIAAERLKSQTAELQDAIRQAEHAAEQRKAWVATLSHEIRTPLNGVLGVASLLRDTPLDPHQAHLVETIRDQADHLRVLLSDLLDFSKLQSSRLRISPRPFELRPLIDSVVSLQSGRALGQGVDMIGVVDPSVPALIKTDPDRLRQVIDNLVNNAVKFTEHGLVSVRVGAPEEHWLRVDVADTGCGIPEDKLGELFEAFTQVDSSPSRAAGGTGLGLAIAWALVEQLGGRIEVSSKVGVGTTFSFSIPAPAIQVQPRPAPLDLDVVWLDNNEAHQAAVSTLLSQLGAQVFTRPPFPREPVWVLSEGWFSTDRWARWLAQSPSRGERTVVVTSPGQQAPDGVAVSVSRPLTAKSLRAALLRVAGRGEHSARDDRPATSPRQHSQDVYPLDIVVADDMPVNRLVVGAMLKRTGHRVRFATNGAEALEAVRQAAPDLVLMDVQMPVVDGLSATRALREAGHPGPVWAFTANAFPEQVAECLDAGMDGYLTKPIDEGALAAVLGMVASAVAEGAAPEDVRRLVRSGGATG